MNFSLSVFVYRRLLQIFLLATDVIAVYVSFIIIRYLRQGIFEYSLFNYNSFIFVVLAMIISNYIFELYEPFRWRSKLFSFSRIAFSIALSVLIIAFGAYIFSKTEKDFFGRGVLLGSSILIYLCSLANRYYVQKMTKKEFLKSRWLLICDKSLYSVFNKENEVQKIDGQFIWSDIEQLNKNLSVAQELFFRSWTGIIIQEKVEKDLAQVLMEARLGGQNIYSFQNFFEDYWWKIPIDSLSASWFAFCEGFVILQSRMGNKIKRLFDIFLSVIFIILFFPIMILAWIIIRLESPGGAIYKQTRVGLGGKNFVIYKFRSMRSDAEKSGAQWAQENDVRVTQFGKFIRLTRIDEFPQLYNIIKGDMSFIGPRPERPEFIQILREKIPYYDLRHLVKPGLTGWAQVRYPYGASIEDAVEKLQFDLFYIKNHSLIFDIIIIFKTVKIVLFGKGR